MTPGKHQAWKSLARFPHLQTPGYEVFYFLPGLLAKKEMAPRSNRRSANLLSVRVSEDRELK